MCERARHSTSVAVFHYETERTGRRVLRSVHGCVVASGYNMPCSVGSDALLVLALAYVSIRHSILNRRPWSVVAGPCPSRPVRAARGCGVQGALAGGHKKRYNAKSQRYNATDSVSDVKARETERDERRCAGPPGTETAPQTIPDPERHSRHASCSLMLK